MAKRVRFNRQGDNLELKYMDYTLEFIPKEEKVLVKSSKFEFEITPDDVRPVRELLVDLEKSMMVRRMI